MQFKPNEINCKQLKRFFPFVLALEMLIKASTGVVTKLVTKVTGSDKNFFDFVTA